ncbi:MAG: cell surface protein SprA, partial [Bacteroidia bacterium]
EGAETEIDLKSSYAWTLASTPSTFPEGNLSNNLEYGYNRAKLAWYIIDPLFQVSTSGLTPSGLNNNASMSNNFTRQILQTEIFPNIQSATGQPMPLPTLDLAYYPSQRGPYNYDVNGVAGISSGVDVNGNLLNPESRWGGIMRSIQTNDFEAANIDFIQFWVMDPFNSDNKQPNTTGALYVDLGNVSEDILKDSRMSYENGLPTNAADAANPTNPNNPYSTTVWGRVPNNMPLVNAFSSDPNARPFQDVGLDGLSDADEDTQFASFLSALAGKLTGGTGSAAYTKAHKDPSSDDYHYYRGDDYDSGDSSVLARYANYNGMDGNSPTQTQYQNLNSGGYPTTGTTLPNNEDVNGDNTMNQDEGYYEYKVNLTPSSMGVGQNFITDIEPGQGTKADGTPANVKWYQIKIPIQNYNSVVGGISDFKSIRFIRMYFKGFDKPIVCRLADLSLIRDEWRGYNFSLQSPGEIIAGDGNQTSFDISAVSIENNGNRVPINYVLPPGIIRDVNVQSANLVQMNEQSMSLSVCNLQDGDARAAYRNTSYDVRSYKNLQMYVHCEAGNPAQALNNGDVHTFIRLGSDYNQNYYEYDLPLQVTAPGLYNTSNQSDQYKVWPLANQINIAFADLESAKEQRNIAMLHNKNITLLTPYTVMVSSGAMITIVGSPNLSTVKAIMIGVRNPKKGSENEPDDGLPKCAQVWVDELRLTGFNESGGWASNARVTAQLADLGSVTLSGNISTPGFGSIEQKVSERSMQNTEGYNLSSSLQLGKFFPQKSGIQIPMYVGLSETFITPEYNPLDPDILMSSITNDPTVSLATKDSLKRVVLSYTKQRSLNFTNVRKERSKTAKKAHFYDVENLSLNYAYTESYHRDVNIDHSLAKSYRGGLTYAFSPKPKNLRPLQKNKWLSKYKSLMLIRDFNFNTAPSQLSFTTDINRQYSEILNRDIIASDIYIQPTYQKNFTMSRLYNFKYDLTKSLSIDFNADNESRVMEPQGMINTQEKRDSVEKSFFDGGTNVHYRHGTNVNYDIPINKIPLFNFITANARYSTNYDWMRAPFSADSLGNTIQNANTLQVNGQLNMLTFYNKIPYFKKLNEGDKKNNPKKNTLNNKLGNSLNTKNNNSKSKTDTTKKDENPVQIVEYIARALMTVKTVAITYSESHGTLLPGYNDSTQVLGMDPKTMSPGFGFLFGQQNFGPKNHNFAEYAGSKDWIVKNPLLNIPFTLSTSKNLNLRANLEPARDLKIELVANQSQSLSLSEFYKWDTLSNTFDAQSPLITGNYTISYLSWRTAFSKTNASNFSQVFQNFLDNRATISQRQAALNPNARGTGFDTTGVFRKGYGAYSQDVLIPSFLAAYSGKSANKVGLSAFPGIPLPNWRITYTGLMRYPIFKKYFDVFSLSSAYRSTYSVASYTTNLLFPTNQGGQYSSAIDSTSKNFQPVNLISLVDISEQFSPLIKIEMTLKNSILANVEIKKSRDIALSISSQQLTEVDGSEYDIGSGYRLKNVLLPFKIFGKPVKSDLNLKVDLAFQNNETVMRNIVENVSQVTSGQDIISIKFSADYMVSTRLTLRAFFDKIINNPLISSTYPTSNANSGISVRFTL